MWVAAAPLPYYSAYKDTKEKVKAKKKAEKDAAKDGSSLSHASQTLPFDAETSRPTTSATTSAASNPPPATPSIAADLLEPAVEGPPSPRRLRALSNKVKQASTDKHRSHHPSFSTSSAINHSPNAEQPAWNQVIENITLSRRSSGRSTSSSMPSRERPDSVQILSKAIFSRKGRLRRESSANSSSGSSLYSGELPMDGPAAQGNKEHFIPAIFSRRKAAKSDPYGDMGMPAAPPSVKPLISGPYNFQHVTHTRRDHLPTLQRASRMELVAEFSTLKSTPHPADISDDSYMVGNPYVEAEVEPHTRIFMDRPTLRTRHTAPNAGPRRLVKTSKSQENLRAIPPRPPRPPRSPIIESDESQYHAPPIPPPRLSSRQSIRYGGYDPLETTSLERPLTSGGGFRQPEPFHFAQEVHEPQMTSRDYLPEAVTYEETLPQTHYLHAVTTHDDEAWPLTPPVPLPPTPQVLAGVPEEEEPRVSRKNRTSVLSTSSSLRRTQSVPQMRHLIDDDEPKTSSRRPPSAGSDTLGRFDLFAAQRALRAAACEEEAADAFSNRSSWEDDIDYCYEHELEADCDYEWSRPSVNERCEEDDPTPIGLDTSRSEQSHNSGSTPDATSGFFLAPDQYDMPALSPASHTSINDLEALTPTAPAVLVTSNFSLPRNDSGLAIQQRPRADSRASSFKESHGFTLSPSLLIPTDYRQQMMMCESDMAGYDNDDAIYIGGYPAFNDKATPAHPLNTVDRVSTSTIGTDSTGRSGSTTDEPHKSIASASTSFTRFTAEHSGSWSPKSEKASNECIFVEQFIPGRSPPPQLTVDFETAVFAQEPKLKSRLDIGRPRAKTTSLTTPPPLGGRFSLFPRPDTMNRI